MADDAYRRSYDLTLLIDELVELRRRVDAQLLDTGRATDLDVLRSYAALAPFADPTRLPPLRRHRDGSPVEDRPGRRLTAVRTPPRGVPVTRTPARGMPWGRDPRFME